MGFGPAVSAAATSFQLLSQIQGQRQERALSEFNEREFRRRATTTREAAVEEQFFARQDLTETVASNLAATGASGVRPSGSPRMANLLAIRNATTNIGILGFNAEQEARGFETQASLEATRREFGKQAGKIDFFSAALAGASRFRTARFERAKRKGTIAAEKKVSAPSSRSRLFPSQIVTG